MKMQCLKTRLIVAFGVALVILVPAHAGTTWTGDGLDGSWGDTNNWGGALPAFDGTETITFASGSASGLATTLDGDRDINKLVLSSTDDFSIDQGTSGTLKLNDLSVAAFGYTITAPVELKKNSTWTSTGPVALNVVVTGGISDGDNGYGITKQGSRELHIGGSNTFTGALTLYHGYLRLSGSGTPSATTILNNRIMYVETNTVFGTGTINFDRGKIKAIGALIINNPVTMSCYNEVIAGSSKITVINPVVLTTNATIDADMNAGINSVPTFSGGFTDNGNAYSLTLIGANFRKIVISGPCDYSGGTIVTDALAWDVIVELAGGNDRLPTNGAVSVMGDAKLLINAGLSQRIASLTGGPERGTLLGRVELLGGSTLIISGSETADFPGVISSSGGVVIDGQANQILSGINTYSGATIVSGGVLRVDGQLASAAGTVTATSQGVLGGTGTVSRAVLVESGGGISAGNTTNDVGMLTVAATATLTDAAKVVWAYDAVTNDVIAVTNLTFSGGQTLEVHNLGRDVSPSESFLVMSCAGTLTGFNPLSWSFDDTQSPVEISVGKASVFTVGNDVYVTGLQAPAPPSGTLILIQ